jgi:CRISPR/Cas system-associated exonuclease Cas4 (RecB family)
MTPVAVPELQAPADMAMELTGRDYISHSQIEQFRRCPRKFAFTYVESARPDFIPQSLLFGSGIHAALECYYQRRLQGQDTDLPQLMEVFEERWYHRRDGEEDIPARLNKTDTEDSIRELVDRMLSSFLASPLAAPNGQVVAIEERFRSSVAADLPEIVSVVDLIVIDAEAIHLVDFKTSRSRWSEAKAAEGAGQLQLYAQMAGHMAERGMATRMHFAVLTKAKKPVVQFLEVPDKPSAADQLVGTFREVWAAMQSRNFYPIPSPMNCATCPFKSHCPAFAG